MLLQDRVIVVTGAASAGSIGDAIATRAIEHGARVIVTSRNEAAAQAAAARLGNGARGDALDLLDPASVDAFAKRVLADEGRVDGVVHNAGHPVGAWDRGLIDIDAAEFSKVFDVDVVGAIRLTQALLPAMVARRRGAFVFTSSTAALAGYDALHEFSPAKAGVLGVMRAVTAEFARSQVRANAVAYGNIASAATLAALDDDAKGRLADESPMRRWGEPREAAGAVVFLLSDLASYVNGQVLVVDGGTVMR